MSQKYSNVSEVPLALAVFLASDDYDYNDDPYTISATTLLRPIRQIILPTRIKNTEGHIDLADMMTLRLGSAIHGGIEKAWLHNHKAAMKAIGYPKQVVDRVVINPDPDKLSEDDIPVYLERRLTKKVGKWTITGKFDFIAEGQVEDFKTANVWSYMNQTNAEKQELQGSLYRWLNPSIITRDEMRVHHIFMDWKIGLVRTDPRYPPKRFITQTLSLRSLAETEAFIRQKLDMIDQYWDASEEDIPYCTDEELWRNNPQYKYYKNPDKTNRSTKNFDNKHDAMVRCIEDGNVGMVKEVPGQVSACKYCNAYMVCTQKDYLISCGDLILE